MAVFRIERTRDYTVMSNHHLRNANLSLKAKGLLSMMLSLPEDWNYTTRGLAKICKEGVDAIGAALRELEGAGYIVRHQRRDKSGRITDTEYVIYEQPQPDMSQPDTASPDTENPDMVNPDMETPDMAVPDTENPPQLNTKLNQEPKNKKLNESRTHSIPSSAPRRSEDEAMWREIILENIEYDLIIGEDGYDRDSVDEAVEQIVDAVSSSKDYIRVGGESRSADVVRSRLLKLNRFHVEFVLDCMKENTTRIRNIRQYLLTALYNAPASMESYYAARVRHDMRGGDAG
mgnify:CR=1 FL=1